MTFYFDLALVVVMEVVNGDVRISVLKFLDHRSWLGGAWGRVRPLLVTHFSPLALTFHYELGDICLIGIC